MTSAPVSRELKLAAEHEPRELVFYECGRPPATNLAGASIRETAIRARFGADLSIVDYFLSRGARMLRAR
jgi:hypothetical protein